jgi:hypothetical protein
VRGPLTTVFLISVKGIPAISRLRGVDGGGGDEPHLTIDVCNNVGKLDGAVSEGLKASNMPAVEY